MKYDGKYDPILKQEWETFFAGVPFNPGWKLARAQMLAESNGNPDAKSDHGAVGLFQLMPATAAEVGVTHRTDPKESIHGGLRYLRRMYDQFRQEEGWERYYFALGSYNAGIGHIVTAQTRAKRLSLPTNKWTSMETVLPSVTGMHAIETINYVKRIRKLYDEA